MCISGAFGTKIVDGEHVWFKCHLLKKMAEAAAEERQANSNLPRWRKLRRRPMTDFLDGEECAPPIQGARTRARAHILMYMPATRGTLIHAHDRAMQTCHR